MLVGDAVARSQYGDRKKALVQTAGREAQIWSRRGHLRPDPKDAQKVHGSSVMARAPRFVHMLHRESGGRDGQ
jgi:hypothetical protein